MGYRRHDWWTQFFASGKEWERCPMTAYNEKTFVDGIERCERSLPPKKIFQVENGDVNTYKNFF